MALSTAIGRPGGQENDVAHTIRTFLDQFGGSNGRLILFGCRKRRRHRQRCIKRETSSYFCQTRNYLGLIRR
jgi:hypothetical protein